jgi:DNA mismatch repair protein MutL
MSSIIQLPLIIANQTAGEVVQRPASVVRSYLVENAGCWATDIKLIIKDAGKALVQVVDNGLGMSVTDARLSLNVMLHQNP